MAASFSKETGGTRLILFYKIIYGLAQVHFDSSRGVVASAPDFERADEGSILTAGLRAYVLSLENLNVIIRAIN